MPRSAGRYKQGKAGKDRKGGGQKLSHKRRENTVALGKVGCFACCLVVVIGLGQPIYTDLSA